jgi:hypothetical protein
VSIAEEKLKGIFPDKLRACYVIGAGGCQLDEVRVMLRTHLIVPAPAGCARARLAECIQRVDAEVPIPLPCDPQFVGFAVKRDIRWTIRSGVR